MKVSIFDAEKRQLLDSNSHLTLLGKGIDEQHMMTTESLTMLGDALKLTAQQCASEHITDVVIIGTEALRRAANAKDAENLVARYFPDHRLEIIHHDKEAELFFEAIAKTFPDTEIATIDIGGGSVQLIKGSYVTKQGRAQITHKNSLPTGTYRLQQRYSPDNSVISTRIAAAHRVIRRAYKGIDVLAPNLIFGSTCMLDFITASGVPTQTDTASSVHPVVVAKPALENFLEVLTKIAPDQRSRFYPEGGYFMHGADYLLMNVLAAIDQLKPSKIYPSNLNSSYAFI